jgi:hypothetical protein
VASVSEVFGYRLEWLLLGRGETKDLDGGSGPESEDQLFEGHLFGDLPRWMKGVAWASGSMRISLLRLLSEVDRALAHVPGITGSEGRQVREAGLKSVVSFLNAALPGVDDSHFLEIAKLPPRQREQVVMHLKALIYLLFRPFRDEETSFLWSKVLTSRDERG